ncbi:NAD(P)H-hydrate dehydratase [Candidatus Micrarchaeota archaeon]|nr:NAD(P)H-hydrate dehydratase [Candidatus Micrarchaeota archaeon]
MNALRSLYSPPGKSRKGDNGRLLIIGGSRDYHGAPMFSILAARRFVDLLYFYPAERDPYLIGAVKRIPEAIVVYDLKSAAMRGKIDCILFGIGISDARVAIPKPETKNTKLVIDGDGLKRVKGRIPKGAILTPHENEFRMLFGMEGSARNVKAMAAKHRCIILKKGPVDIISNGKRTVTNRVHNQGMTKGGTGDVLAGLVAALACKNDSFTAAVAGAIITGNAGNMLKRKYGYNFCASELADVLAESAAKL